jgi:hypothetical protein
MKVGTKVKFRFAGTNEVGVVEGKNKNSGSCLVRGEDNYLYPIEASKLKKI